MSISTQEDADRTSKFAAVLKTTTAAPSESEPPRRRRRLPRWVTVLVVVASVLGLGAATLSSGVFSSGTGGRVLLTEKARRGDLIVSIAEDGNVESAANKDVKCEVKGGSTILWLIKDGTEVQKGDELARLDSSSLEDQITQQTITYEKAHSLAIESEKNFKAAEIAVSEYIEGTYLQTLQDLKAKAVVAKENLGSAQNTLQFTDKMTRKGYATALQREAQAFAVQRANLDLAVANTAIDVLEKFTRPKTLVGLESARDSAEARMRSEKAAFELEEARLERLKQQLEKCTIVAPDNGMVIYANDQSMSGRGGGSSQQAIIEEGATVRERQSIMRLPDLSHMQVKCTVHESKVDSLSIGMRARIRIQDREFQGIVTSVANQAEPTSFFSGNVKEYATIVSIESDPHGLRPGMTAAVEILVANLSNVLSVPVQAVVEKGGKFYCWVNAGGVPQKRPVILGLSNNTRIEIKDGLSEGDEVLLNPRASVEEAREEEKTEEKVDVNKKFGNAKPGESANPQGKAPAGRGDQAKGGKGGRNFDLMALDKDGDKKISLDEAPEQMKAGFERMDTNKDGFIDAKEGAAAMARFRQMQQQQQGGGADRGGPGGGPGRGGN